MILPAAVAPRVALVAHAAADVRELTTLIQVVGMIDRHPEGIMGEF